MVERGMKRGQCCSIQRAFNRKRVFDKMASLISNMSEKMISELDRHSYQLAITLNRVHAYFLSTSKIADKKL